VSCVRNAGGCVVAQAVSMWEADTTGVKARYDYLSFGEFVPASRSGRTSASCAVGVADCYPGSGTVTNARVTQMFTGK
jgi:hypothetical protein